MRFVRDYIVGCVISMENFEHEKRVVKPSFLGI